VTAGDQQAASSVRCTTSCKHSLVLLRMGEIITRNMLSCLKLLIKLLLLHLVGSLYYYNFVEPGCLVPISFFKFHIKHENKLHVLEFDYNNLPQNVLSFRQLYKNQREKLKFFFVWLLKFLQLSDDRPYSARPAGTTLISLVLKTGENSTINMHAHNTTARQFNFFF